jgi:uncharacterized protein YbjT (DUF2867 family)
MRIAIAGGTGTVGRFVTAAVRAGGHEAVVLARATGVDVVSGAGLDAALDGVDAVIDALGVTTLAEKDSVAFFSATTTNLLTAARRVGVGSHVALSIVGIDRSPGGYYAGKLAQERLIEANDVPWTIVRATQFHEFAAQMFTRAAIGPLHLAPRMRTQPIAAREVGTYLVAAAETPATGRIGELGGPREEQLPQMVRAYARAHGTRGWIPAISLPGASGRAQRDGSLLPGSDAVLGTETFAEWLRSPDAR